MENLYYKLLGIRITDIESIIEREENIGNIFADKNEQLRFLQLKTEWENDGLDVIYKPMTLDTYLN
jgi:hypothetical protein